jgi:hypothetical protein
MNPEFQRLYTPIAFCEERILWCSVIQLNIVRSVRLILDALTTPGNAAGSRSSSRMVSSSSPGPLRVHTRSLSGGRSGRRPSGIGREGGGYNAEEPVPVPPHSLAFKSGPSNAVAGLDSSSSAIDNAGVTSPTKHVSSMFREYNYLPHHASSSRPGGGGGGGGNSYASAYSQTSSDHDSDDAYNYDSNSITQVSRHAPASSTAVDSSTAAIAGRGGGGGSAMMSSATAHHQYIKDLIAKLHQPLLEIEQLLTAMIVPANEDEPAGFIKNFHNPSSSSRFGSGGGGYGSGNDVNGGNEGANNRLSTILTSGSNINRGWGWENPNSKIFIRPRAGMQGTLSRARVHYVSLEDEGGEGSAGAGGSDDLNDDGGYDSSPEGGLGHTANGTGTNANGLVDETQKVLHSVRREMVALWEDEHVQRVLKRKKVRVEEGSGL